MESKNGVVDLRVASETLKVQKRRLYDVTNVLNSIGIVTKKGPNKIEWINNSNCIDLNRELAGMQEEVNNLDQLIDEAQKNLDKSYAGAYVTCDDFKSLASYKDQSIIALKAPLDATLYVSQTIRNFGQRKLQISTRSTQDEIDVFLYRVPTTDICMTPSQPIVPALVSVMKKDEFLCETDDFSLRVNDDNDELQSKDHYMSLDSCMTPGQPIVSALSSVIKKDALQCETDDFGLPVSDGRLKPQSKDPYMSLGTSIKHFEEPLHLLDMSLYDGDYSSFLGLEENIFDICI